MDFFLIILGVLTLAYFGNFLREDYMSKKNRLNDSFNSAANENSVKTNK